MTDFNLDPAGIYKRSFSLFCKDIVKQPIGKIHKEIISNLENDTTSNFSIMIARGHYKTYVFSRTYPLWLIYKSDKPVHILIQSMNQDMARRILGLIRDVLITNPYFSHFKFKKETDKLLELYIPGHEDDSENTHRIYSVPVGTRGLHVDLVIVDDIMKDDDGNSSTNMKKLKRIFWNATAPMANGRNGRILFIGTPICYDDLFNDLYQLSLTDSGWLFYRYPALYEDENGELVPSFPEVYPMEKLLKIKNQLPSWTWEQEYMLNPVSGEDSIFPLELLNIAVDLDYPKLSEEDEKFKSYYLGCDFAMSSSSTADYSAFCVVSKAPNRPINLEFIWHERGVSEYDQIQQIKNLCRVYNIDKAVVERKGITYSMGNKLIEDPELSSIVENWNPTNEEKQKILGNVNLLLQHKMLRIPSDLRHSDLLIKEMQTFGIINENGTQKYKAISGHDDLVIGVALAISAAGGWVFEEDVPTTIRLI
ncbi:MAG: hypothetical protein PWP52_1643 [Bacteroidales bacterium]|nr:hypothetical protein [Bacteroidales bacterium]MDN5355783.1 hypothetical protein [Rikenellaceae bacterium]